LRTIILAVAAVALVEAATPSRRSVEYEDLAPSARELLRSERIDAKTFGRHLRDINRRSRIRRDAGDREHLIYFILQSTRFTDDAPIEPSQSARWFVDSLKTDERNRLLEEPSRRPSPRRLPAAVARRFEAFLLARERGFRPIRETLLVEEDERIAYFARMLPRGSEAALVFLHGAYIDAMRFLYRKEHVIKAERTDEKADRQSGDDRNAAELYQDRGHSTDTAFEANFAVDLAIGILAQLDSNERLRKILVVGPGLDLAPRTDLIDIVPPQSYQPFAVADSLLRRGLTEAADLSIHCVDINDAVVSYLTQVHERRLTELTVLSGLADHAARPLAQEYRQYFHEFGTRIGTPSGRARPAGRHGDRLFTSIAIAEPIARRITAERLNIVTERYETPHVYDLVIATNVFPYFTDAELVLALSNISSMLRGGGYLMHNETRPVLQLLAGASGLAPVQLRSVLVAPHAQPPLHDAVWIHRKGV
jgi:hypothetical protein